MWVVVLFLNDESVEAVPSTWMITKRKQQQCAWPLKNSHVARYIEKCVPPNENDFKLLPARQLGRAYATLRETKLKALIAENTSDLSAMEDCKETRKIRARILSESPSPSPKMYKKQRTIESPPTLHSPQIKKLLNSDKSNPNENKFEQSTHGLIKATTSNDNIQDDHAMVNLQTPVTSKFNSPKRRLFSFSDNSEEEFLNYETPLNNQTPKYVQVHSSVVTSMSAAKSANFKSSHVQKSSKPNSTVFQDFVVRSLNIVKTEIQALNASIQHTHLIMDKIYEKLSSNNTTCGDISNGNSELDSIFPIKSVEELDNLEDELKNKKNWKQQIVFKLSYMTGKDVGDSVRRIMKRFFCDSVLQNYSYIGFKGKKSFSILECCDIVKDSVRSKSVFNKTTDEEIESHIKKWLAGSPQRLKNNYKT